MAAKSSIAKRYARAFAEVSGQGQASQKNLESLELLVLAFEKDPKLSAFLKSPAFKGEEKWSVVADVLKKHESSRELTQFVKVLLDSNRITYVEEVVSEFKKIMLEKSGEAEAIIESAYALTESELSLVKANLEKGIGKKLRIKVEVEPSLVAGLRVRVDGKTLDGTLSSYMNRLQNQLLRAEA